MRKYNLQVVSLTAFAMCILLITGTTMAPAAAQKDWEPKSWKELMAGMKEGRTPVVHRDSGPQKPGAGGGEALALTFYNNRAMFQAAAPGLPLENFENTLVPPASVGLCTGPFNCATNDGCYAPGGILDGISLDGIPVGGDGSMVVLTAGFLGLTSAVVGPNFFADNLEITFPGPTNAVGFDLLDPLFGPATFNVDVYDAGNNLLGSTLVVSGIVVGQFVGVISTNYDIARIEVTDVGGVAQLVDDVEFAVGGGLCLQDDRNGNTLKLLTCSYEFTVPGHPGSPFTGPVVVSGGPTVINFASGPGDFNRLQGGISVIRGVGNARISVPGAGVFTIADSNLADSVCP